MISLLRIIANRIVARPPLLYRVLFPECIWRLHRKKMRAVYLTFDDGPVPEVTPWVLKTLREHDVKATFFLVGDNAKRHPELVQAILAEGHSIGNHTMHHTYGMKVTANTYVRSVLEADQILQTPLFRPPHGLMRWKQSHILRSRFTLIMYDVVSRDYARQITPQKVLGNVIRLVRNGSIIVFHDSLKAQKNMEYALPRAIKNLKSRGFKFLPIPMDW